MTTFKDLALLASGFLVPASALTTLHALLSLLASAAEHFS